MICPRPQLRVLLSPWLSSVTHSCQGAFCLRLVPLLPALLFPLSCVSLIPTILLVSAGEEATSPHTPIQNPDYRNHQDENQTAHLSGIVSCLSHQNAGSPREGTLPILFFS